MIEVIGVDVMWFGPWCLYTILITLLVLFNHNDKRGKGMDNPEQVKSFLTYLVQVNETIIKYKNKEIQGEEEQGKEDLDANRIQ